MQLWSIRHPAKAVAALAAGLAVVAGLWTWRGVVERDFQREREAKAEVVRKADERVEEIKGRVRTHIKTMISNLDPRKAEDYQAQVLPALVWIEWLTDDPVISSNGAIAAIPERIELLRTLVAQAEAEGRAGHTDAMLARFALAHLLIWEDKSSEVEPILLVLDLWAKHHDPDDPTRLALAAMRACVDAEDPTRYPSNTTGDARHADTSHAKTTRDRVKAALANLDRAKSTLAGKHGSERVLRLIERVQARVTAAASRE